MTSDLVMAGLAAAVVYWWFSAGVELWQRRKVKRLMSEPWYDPAGCHAVFEVPAESEGSGVR